MLQRSLLISGSVGAWCAILCH